MRIRVLAAALVLMLACVPGLAHAQGSQRDDSVLVRVNGSARVFANELIDVVVVVDGDADIAGVVDDVLVVVHGTAIVTGTIDGDVVIVDGTLRLEDSARVDGDIYLSDSQIERAPGAVVTGAIDDDWRVRWSGWWDVWDAFIFTILLWIGTTLAFIIVGLVFAAIGGRQLLAASHLISDRTGASVASALLLFLAIPIIAVITFLTIVGIPIGLMLTFIVLPVVWVLGYVVAGVWLGMTIIERQKTAAHPYRAVLLGVLILQLITLIPFLGGLIAVLAGLLGAGALAVQAWQVWRLPTIQKSDDRTTEAGPVESEPAG